MGKKFETFNNGCFTSKCYLKNNPSVIQDIFGEIQHKITLYKTSVTQELSVIVRQMYTFNKQYKDTLTDKILSQNWV